MDLHDPIKQALARAKEHVDRREPAKAAAAYEKAANLMAIYADQAIGREAELRRKKKVLEWREVARRLRSGEAAPEPGGTPARSAAAKYPAPRLASAPGSAAGGGSAGEREPAGGGGAGGEDDRDDDAGAGPGATPGAGANPEIRAAVSQLITYSPLTWEDVGGLDETKNGIKYALGITLAKPPEGLLLSAWTRILFYGPPGTGKTLLAAATSNALRNSEGVPAVFFNVKVSSVLSKYFGESSKIVSELYGMARDASPSVIFLDEFESLCARRDSGDTGPERRLLSTLLSELDGLEQKGRRDIYVLTIAATNRPWDLDPAILSRFEKKILIPLPDAETRRRILFLHLYKRGFRSSANPEMLVRLTEGMSGREIEGFCKEVSSRMVAEMNRDLPRLVDAGLDEVQKYQIRVRDLTPEDFDHARARIHPQTTPEEMRKYVDWSEAHTG
ncbi:MAG: ATP-binding protein [Planctomycetes bacterium]|nr:ATP-binding protein [Planctomycetota bacterium]